MNEQYFVTINPEPYGIDEVVIEGTLPECRAWCNDNLQYGQLAYIMERGAGTAGFAAIQTRCTDGRIEEIY